MDPDDFLDLLCIALESPDEDDERKTASQRSYPEPGAARGRCRPRGTLVEPVFRNDKIPDLGSASFVGGPYRWGALNGFQRPTLLEKTSSETVLQPKMDGI